MMKRVLKKAYAWVLLIFLVTSFVSLFVVSWSDLDALAGAVLGVTTAVVFVPAYHELGHVLFAVTNRLQVVYCKCFCVKFYVKDGKKRVGFANPFAPDETQVLPMGSENMQRRAYAYAVGGLVASAVVLVLSLAIWLALLLNGRDSNLMYAWLAYAAYLFLLNVLPVEYATGKTDALVVRGIRKGEPVEQTMLNVMRIQGELQAGKSYVEIEKDWYFSAPQISVEEPLYVAILEARYAYFVELEEYEKALDCLKRIKEAGDYLSEEEILRLEKNLAYLCLLGGNDEVLKTAAKNDEEYWKSDDVAIKRTLALYMQKCGEAERASLLVQQAEALIEKQPIAGLRKHEQLLLSRIKQEN